MDDFDDFPSNRTQRNENQAGHQSSNSQHIDPFAASTDSFPQFNSTSNYYSNNNPSQSTSNPSHVLVDADELDLMGDDDDDFNNYNQNNSRVPKSGNNPHNPYNLSSGLSAPNPPFTSIHSNAASQESGLPLAQSAAYPAGRSPFDDSYSTGGNDFKSIEADDEVGIYPSSPYEDQRNAAAGGASAGMGMGSFLSRKPDSKPNRNSKRDPTLPPSDSPMDGFRRSIRSLKADMAKIARRGKDPLPPTGERIARLNDPVGNEKEDYCDNWISTSKYNVVTFLPKFLVGE